MPWDTFLTIIAQLVISTFIILFMVGLSVTLYDDRKKKK